jgi:hypothetical protein
LVAHDVKINNIVMGVSNASIQSPSFKDRVSHRNATTIINSRKKVLRKTLAITRLKSQGIMVSADQLTEIISLFSQELIDICQKMFPFLYTCIELFYAPCVDVQEIKAQKQRIIEIVSDLLIRGPLAHRMIQLSRF